MIYIFWVISVLSLIGLALCYIGEKVIQITAQNAFVYNVQGVASTYSKTKYGSGFVGFLLGLLTFDTGLFSYMNNKISLGSPISDRERNQLIIWNLAGQYFFTLLVFAPSLVYIPFVAAAFLFFWWIDKFLFPHSFSLLIGFVLLKLSTVVLFFAINFITVHAGDQIFINLAPYFQNLALMLAIGILLGLLFKTLILPMIVLSVLIYATGIPYILGLVFLLGLHTGMGIHYWRISRQLQGTAADFTKTFSLANFLLALLYVLLGSFLYFKQDPWHLSSLISFPLAAFMLALVEVIVVSLFQPLLSLKNQEPKFGRKYYFPHGFSNTLACGRVFGRELLRFISPVIHHTLSEQAQSNETRLLYLNRFKELSLYRKNLKHHYENTLTAQQIDAMLEIFEDVVNLESNFQRRSDLLSDDFLPTSLKQYASEVKKNRVEWNDFLRSTFISILQNPKEESSAKLEETANRLCMRIEELRLSLMGWAKENLKGLSITQEEAILEYLLLYESDAALITHLAEAWKKWVKFNPNYYQPHLEYQ